MLLRAAGADRDMLFVSGLGGDGGDGGDGGEGAAGVRGGGELTAFAPWEHPHLAGSEGCWLGVHPCQTSAVMALLLSTVDAVQPAVIASVESVAESAVAESVVIESAVEPDAAAPLRYMLAWIRLAASSVADLPIPPSLLPSRSGLSHRGVDM